MKREGWGVSGEGEDRCVEGRVLKQIENDKIQTGFNCNITRQGKSLNPLLFISSSRLLLLPKHNKKVILMRIVN